MNIFEDFYNKKMTIEEFVSSLSSAMDVSELKKGFEKFNPNSPEEYLTQIFTHIMLQDDHFKEKFFKTIGIDSFEKELFTPRSEYKFNGSQKEIDVFAADSKNILIIENKIGDRIEDAQPDDYMFICNNEGNNPVKKDKRKRYFVVLAKFSDLMKNSDWDGNVCIKEHLNGKLQKICNDYEFKGHYIYWYEIYNLLELYFSNDEIKADLLEFLRNQNLHQEWCRDIGSPDWRRRFIEAYNSFATEKEIEPFSNPSCGRKLGPLGNNKICFVGSRVQGARSAEAAAQKDKNDELCCFLKLEIKNKSGKKEYIDLSDCCYGPIETIIENCSEAILEAYGKK